MKLWNTLAYIHYPVLHSHEMSWLFLYLPLSFYWKWTSLHFNFYLFSPFFSYFHHYYFLLPFFDRLFSPFFQKALLPVKAEFTGTPSVDKWDIPVPWDIQHSIPKFSPAHFLLIHSYSQIFVYISRGHLSFFPWFLNFWFSVSIYPQAVNNHVKKSICAAGAIEVYTYKIKKTGKMISHFPGP